MIFVHQIVAKYQKFRLLLLILHYAQINALISIQMHLYIFQIHLINYFKIIQIILKIIQFIVILKVKIQISPVIIIRPNFIRLHFQLL